ncbi:MAG: ABC transporter substrate-binding protein [Betaproteobacteria bacterium]|nr:ABC transporter substrate-binding protein [Betaproteobacteria bacterium]
MKIALALVLWSGAAIAQVSAIDTDGRRITLEKPAERIVSLAPHVTELLFAAGAGAKVVGVSRYSDFPPAARGLPIVGDASAIDLERALALRPDLAAAWRINATAQSLDRLAALGVPVFYSEPHRLAQIPEQLEALGVLAGTQAAARVAAGDLRSLLHELESRYAARAQVSVFFQISERPLMTVNGRQLISDALAVCGARNVFADAPTIAPVVNAEAVVAADPDVILAARDDARDVAWSAAWRRFSDLRAVRDENLVTVPAVELNRQGPRVFAATRRLCGLLDEARSRASRLKAASPR